MFRVEEDNARIGKYLSDIIERKYESKRAFCRAYIQAAGKEPTNETINNMCNRLSQIIKGKKSIQTYDLPYFSELLGLSCEQILSASECSVPTPKRVTNHSIACSKDPAEWEQYINHPDKLVLNSDEYCKTVLDYALEFGNYEFIKFLMDHKYIWFDSGDDHDYVLTFGAGTSIKRRHIGSIDCDLEGRLKTKDDLRISLITLAADNNDIDMLNALRARENPQLYFRAHYLSAKHPDFSIGYSDLMIRHIVESSHTVLDYFTDPFEIRDNVRYKDGSKRTHTFMFPYISKLLDQLVVTNSSFAETALKKALEYNQKTFERLHHLILAVKNDERFAPEYMRNLWIETCKRDFQFHDDGDIVIFSAFYSSCAAQQQIDGIITNVPHVTKVPCEPVLKHLVEELNASYLRIRDIAQHLEEI